METNLLINQGVVIVFSRPKVREEKNRGKQQNMTEDELSFFDALGINDSAVKVLGDETLRKIALGLTQMIRNRVAAFKG